MIDVPWRPGKSVGRTIYGCPPGSSYRDGEQLIGMMDTPEAAHHICELHNWWLDLKKAGEDAMEQWRRERYDDGL